MRTRRMAVEGYRRHRRPIHRAYIMKKQIIRLLSLFILMIPVIAGIIYVDAMGSNVYEELEVSVKDVKVHTSVVNLGAIAATNMTINRLQNIQTLEKRTINGDLSVNEPIETTFIEEPVVETPKPITLQETLNTNLGNREINTENAVLTRCELPDTYYPGVDYSSFQPYMDYHCVTNRRSTAYGVVHSELAYTDEYGMRRYRVQEDQFSIDGKDDYMIALGTFYKEKGTAGSRYLIVTTTGMYTAITGDEKADKDTDPKHMFSLHRDGTCAGIIEWLVDQNNLERGMRRAGTITAGPIEELQGKILHIYKIS